MGKQNEVKSFGQQIVTYWHALSLNNSYRSESADIHCRVAVTLIIQVGTAIKSKVEHN